MFRVEGDDAYDVGVAGSVAGFGPPSVLSQEAEALAPTEAVVRGVLEKFWAAPAQYRLEYRRGAGPWTAGSWLGAPAGAFAPARYRPKVTIVLLCLTPASSYDYRLAARDQAGAVRAAVGTFATPAGQPCASAVAAAAPAPPTGKHRRPRFERNATIAAPLAR